MIIEAFRNVRNTLSPYMSIRVCRIRTSRGFDNQFLFSDEAQRGRGEEGGMGLVCYICRFINSEREKEALLHTCHNLVCSISCLTCHASFNLLLGREFLY